MFKGSVQIKLPLQEVNIIYSNNDLLSILSVWRKQRCNISLNEHRIKRNEEHNIISEA